jgi:NTP pyrophosphatase (non-canonical NTP hydrolase)
MHSVYLAGPMRQASEYQMTGWRAEATEFLKARGYGVKDPVARYGLDHDSIVLGDLADVRACVCVLAWMPSGGLQGIGTCMEIFYASHVLGRRVVVWGHDMAHPSPWIEHHAVLLPSLKCAVEYIADTSAWKEAGPSPLTFARFSRTNVRRCFEGFGKEPHDWTPEQWGNALAGEVGETCNLIKKICSRGEDIPLSEIGKEIADVVTYADLLCARLGLDLEDVLRQKFNEVSARKNCSVMLD